VTHSIEEAVFLSTGFWFFRRDQDDVADIKIDLPRRARYWSNKARSV